MKITLLGTGTPWPSAERSASAMLLTIGDKNILVDAGPGAAVQMAKIGMHPAQIDFICLTHHHIDHIGGLDAVLLAAWNDGRKTPIEIYGPVGTNKIISLLFDGVYARDITFRQLEAARLGAEMPKLIDLIVVNEVTDKSQIHEDNWHFECRFVEHGHSVGLTQETFPCLGYRFINEDHVVTFSGDSVECDAIKDLAQNADLLVQCCYLPRSAAKTVELQYIIDNILACSEQANRVAIEAKVKKMVLVHLSPKTDDFLEDILSEASQNFSGSVVIGSDLMQIDL